VLSHIVAVLSHSVAVLHYVSYLFVAELHVCSSVMYISAAAM